MKSTFTIGRSPFTIYKVASLTLLSLEIENRKLIIAPEGRR